nr:AN1-type zinc finger protein 4-like isoform X1 [Procambarus clarkii]
MRGGGGNKGHHQRFPGGGKDAQGSGYYSSDSDEEDTNGRRRGLGPHLHQEDLDADDSIALDSSYPPAGEYADDDEEEDAIEVTVETLMGDSYRVRVSQWDTALGLKGLLYRTQGIPTSHQHLILGERELLDDSCLIEQGVMDGSTLRLVLSMRGGPINARRLPTQEDLLWREVTEYIDVNRDDLWDGVGGRTVTLLVLRDGENVNLYRVVENQDGSFSPLNESWGSMGSSGRAEELANQTQQVSEEEAKTRARMVEIRARMAEMKIRNKAKSEKVKVSPPSRRSLSRSSKVGTENHEDLPSSKLDMSQGLTRIAVGSSRSSTRQHSGSKLLSTVNRRGGRVSRPTTQERSEFVRASIARPTLKELPNVNPIPIDFSRKKPLENIRPQGDRSRLNSVNESTGRGRLFPLPDTPNTQVQSKHYDSYRKSIVKHGKGTDSGGHGTESEGDRDTFEAWPRRDVSKPLYMLPETTRTRTRRYDDGRLNRSHNQALMRSAQHTAHIRPKTSPEVLERRPGTSGDLSTIGERIHLRAPDDNLRKLCDILGSSRGNSRQSHHLANSPPETTFPKSNLSDNLSTSNGLSRSHKTNSVSVSLASLRSRGGTPPSPGPGALVASGSREQRDILRGLMRSQGGASRRTTPEDARFLNRRPGSGKVSVASSHLPPFTPRRKGRLKQKCQQCSKRLGVATTYECRCGGIFCAQHRYAETHTCTYDYRAAGRNFIQMSNPLVAPNKLPKI